MTTVINTEKFRNRTYAYTLAEKSDGTWSAYGVYYEDGLQIPAGEYAQNLPSREALIKAIVDREEEDRRRKLKETQEKWDARQKARAEKAAKAEVEAKRAREDYATPRQVEFILDLIAKGRHEEGGFFIGPTSREEIKKMTRANASLYITSLLGDY
ncbi:hypothetical protein [Trueperella pyogenes]|uniref:hypothetical protein n=1 Tax=Trueperella pyogenes TaxID=1661 RepID=UPI00312B4EF3